MRWIDLRTKENWRTLEGRARKSVRFDICLLFFLLLLSISCGGSNPNEKKLRILTSTTMIQSIVSEIGGESVEVEAIVPAGMCPGHFDIKPRQVAMISEADLVISHGWESWLENLPIRASAKMKAAPIKGNWLVPEVHIQATRWVENIIAEADPANSGIYKANSDRYISRLGEMAAEIEKRFQKYRGVKVICSELQSEFVAWLGLEVVATYGRSEDLTPAVIAEIINIGKHANAGLVIDNLQSGPEVGIAIAKEIGAQHAVLSNFPEDDGYVGVLRRNADSVEYAITRWLDKGN